MAQGVDTLTDREREVLKLLLAGHTAKSIASELDLSVHTVNDYLREARKKLGVTSSREAARILGEREQTAPQNLAPEQIGMGVAAKVNDTPSLSATPGKRSYLPWIIGVIVMLTAALAVALLTTTSVPSDQAPQETSTVAQKDSVAEAAARSWIRLIDAGDYTESWSQAGPMFKSTVTADMWADQAEPVRKPLGSVITRSVKTITMHSELPGVPAGEYCVVAFDTDFSSAEGSVETVVMRKEDGRWGVVGYFIK